MESISVEEAQMNVNDSLYVCTVGIEDPEICTFLATLKEEERSNYVKRALQVGIIALQGVETRMRVDYVQSEFERMRAR